MWTVALASPCLIMRWCNCYSTRLHVDQLSKETSNVSTSPSPSPSPSTQLALQNNPRVEENMTLSTTVLVVGAGKTLLEIASIIARTSTKGNLGCTGLALAQGLRKASSTTYATTIIMISKAS